MAQRPKRVSIGFQGGQILSAKIPPESLDRLRGALGGDGWTEVAAEDGTMHVNLREVVYLLVDSDEPKVGFFGAS